MAVEICQCVSDMGADTYIPWSCTQIHGMECVHEIVSQWMVTKLMEYNFLQPRQCVISDDDDKAAHLIC